MENRFFPEAGSDYGLTLKVNERAFNIAFTHVGPVTIAAIVFDGPHGYKVVQAGRATCNHSDVYKQATGDRLALKRALRIGEQDPWLYRGPLAEVANAIYAQFRQSQREAQAEVI